MLIIAYRLANVKNCDTIIVMDKGKIVEQGTHEELIENKGQYFKLWEMQQGNYVIKDKDNDKINEANNKMDIDLDTEDTISYI